MNDKANKELDDYYNLEFKRVTNRIGLVFTYFLISAICIAIGMLTLMGLYNLFLYCIN